MDEPTIRRKFQHTELDGNMNRFWMVEWWPGLAKTTWGRFGVSEQTKDFHGWTQWDVERKIREKLEKGYVEVDLAKPQVIPTSETKAADPKLASIIDTIYREAGEYVASYLAVGVDALSQAQVNKGRQLLAAIQDAQAKNPRFVKSLVQQFYNVVPTKLPHRIDIDEVATNFLADLSEQDDRLNQLEAAIAGLVVRGGTGTSTLGADLSVLPQSHGSYGFLVDWITRTSVHGYRPQVTEILEVNIPSERAAFDREGTGKDNVKQLFHGTRGQNVRHILRSGLVIPRAVANGRMFGSGIYLADKFSKSANYCSSNRAPYQFCFVVEAALGRQYIANTDMGSLTSAPSGHDSVWGKEGYTKSWGGRLNYNEFIVYRPSQQTIRYVILFRR